MFAQQQDEPNGSSLYERWRGKAQRFLARAARRQLLPLTNEIPIVTFTFDDVAVSACERGAAILEQYGARGTFYVAARGCGATSPTGALASMDQIKVLWGNEHEIGCHTYSHPVVPRISLAELSIELDQNCSALKNVDSKLVLRNFAYPYGELSLRTKRFLEDRFDSCRSTRRGINTAVADLGSLRAWPLENSCINRTRIDGLIDEVLRLKGWLIFYSHDVAERPSQFGVTPDLLEWAVNRAREAGCFLAPVSTALRFLRPTR